MSDGVSLISVSHPVAPWYRRWWFALRRPRLSLNSLETMWIDIPMDYSDEKFFGKKPTLEADAFERRWVDESTSLNAGNLFNGAFNVDDKEIEQEIQDKGLTAPRVTLADIEACISYEYCATGERICKDYLANVSMPLRCLTICILVLKNGFTVTGESACVSPENFDAELGRKIARQKAVDKIWMLEGYLLKDRLSRDAINRSGGGGDFGDS